jgi:hypothetical protein
MARLLAIVLALAAASPALPQDGIEAGLYIDGRPYVLSSAWCSVLRSPAVPWWPPAAGYALQFGAQGQPQSGRVYVQPGGVTLVLPVITCVDRLFTAGFEPTP